jgi:acyl-coenzyme A thioesterase PaaI-like protein
LHIDFLPRPEPADVVADGAVLRLGKAIAVMEVSIRSTEPNRLVAKAQVTYAIPSDR